MCPVEDDLNPRPEIGSAHSSRKKNLDPRVTFESLTFSDGTSITLGPNDIVAFVGPNNAGKSAALRELENHAGRSQNGVVISKASIKKVGNEDDLRQYLLAHSQSKGAGPQARYEGLGYSIPHDHLDQYWRVHFDNIKGLFISRIPTEIRISYSNPQQAISTLDEVPKHPIQSLFVDDRIEARISEYFHRAFGQDLILYRGGGANWPLMVGTRPELQAGEDRVSATYSQRLLAEAVPLQGQGDGMRSFASVILQVLVPSTQTIFLLDEPEAFLHPPQARLLGEFVAREKPNGAQLFIATHSPDVLNGLLSAAPNNLRIVRLHREGSINHAKELDNANTRRIASDPLMKFSGVLGGVFHARVIICESDSDCMFYNAILDLPEVRGELQPDVLFLHAGGKHRMAALAVTLGLLDVQIDIVADIDALNDETTFRRLVEAVGAQWTEVKADWQSLKTAIEQHKPTLSSGEISKEVQRVAASAPHHGEFPRELKSSIDALFRKASPWDSIKQAGRAAIPPGQAMQQYNRIVGYCAAFGLWLVPVGEIEGFCRSEGGHGPAWVQNVLLKHDLGNDPELADARGFLNNIRERTRR